MAAHPRVPARRTRALAVGLVLATGVTACIRTPDPPTTTTSDPVASATAASPSVVPTELPDPFDAVARTPAIHYGPGAEQVLDTYVPGDEVPSPTGEPSSRPAIVLVHGGGWVTGTRTANHPVAVGLAALGWIAVTVDYRLAPDHRHPAAAEDVRAALGWVHDRAGPLGIDPDRVVLGGDSAGGHLSGLVALSDDRPPVAAWVSWSGAYDFTTLPQQLAGTEHAFLIDHIAAYLGCEPPGTLRCADRAAAASPTSRVSPDDPPSLLLHSTDELIPLADARAMHDALADAGVVAELVTFEGAAHGGGLYERASEEMADFLTDVLGLVR